MHSADIEPDMMRSPVLKGTTTIVTGAGRGIGKAIALAFAQAGANVVCVSRTASEIEAVVSQIESSTPGSGVAVIADVSSSTSAKLIVDTAVQRFGPVSILINNAGIDKINTVEHERCFESWWRVLEVNLRGPAALIHQVLPSMLSRGTGVIISLGSRNGAIDFPFMTAYSAAKTALLRFHQCLEQEIQGRGVSHFYLQPGDVATTLTHQPGVIDLDTVEKVPALQKMLESTVGRSTASPCHVADICLQLALNENSRHLSGRYVDSERDLQHMIQEVRADSSLYRLTMMGI
ncbi:Dehydrogenase/reductase SDR family member 7B [Penicillium pulvis]|uniref:Dehydrogenase/reductase SDR family member 7B n=1 Tax=Penicillium pulvis TaxID=1562058 RepID=UPI0025495AD7|nr:Dehydrogenase/reductase SDR family member 7B [Penicillium pulvis]KAJ5805662.1 Dehydrogenase/reductase SDR family member 7B [Penicillium pulvis]